MLAVCRYHHTLCICACLLCQTASPPPPPPGDALSKGERHKALSEFSQLPELPQSDGESPHPLHMYPRTSTLPSPPHHSHPTPIPYLPHPPSLPCYHPISTLPCIIAASPLPSLGLIPLAVPMVCERRGSLQACGPPAQDYRHMLKGTAVNHLGVDGQLRKIQVREDDVTRLRTYSTPLSLTHLINVIWTSQLLRILRRIGCYQSQLPDLKCTFSGHYPMIALCTYV